MTKHLTLEVIEKHLSDLSMFFSEGRADVASKVYELARARYLVSGGSKDNLRKESAPFWRAHPI